MRARDLGVWPWLLAASFLLVVAGLYLALVWAPQAAGGPEGFRMPAAQRIFYFHVPSYAVSAIAYLIVFIGSVMYLWKRTWGWDALAHTAAEIGVVFTTLTLLSGSIWGRAEWQTWWTWEPRLVTVLVMWLIYVSYLLARSYAAASQAPNFAAVIGIVGFVDVPIVFFAIRWWRTVAHPEALEEGGGLDPAMMAALMVCLVAFWAFFAVLMQLRLSLRRLEREAEILRERLGG